ncbi:MAG: TlpA family protein disulfide reductase [Opitutaceae bacterium]|nr:TlpA family protein disulfide reductase [Opitutaceae bacterium]
MPVPRTLLALSGALLSLTLTPVIEGAPDGAYAEALADLRQAYTDSGVLGTTKDSLVAVRTQFFERVAVESLGPREIAELVRLNGFSYSDVAIAQAKPAAEKLKAPAGQPDVDGALAAALRVLLAQAAGIKGDERAAAIQAALHHPAFISLLQGDYGDLALDVACRAGLRGELHRAFVMSLAGKLDATNSTAAADSVAAYWDKVKSGLPEGEPRQRIRQELAVYLTAVLATPSAGLSAQRRARAENALGQLNSIAARGGTLIGQPAPELHFLWSSEGNWQSLSDLRGKVVVLDFWATWCGHCVASFPKVAELTERYRNTEVVVVGVTSLQGAVHGMGKTIDCRNDPEKEMRLMAEYMKAKAMTWPVVFSREKAANPEYGIDGIPHVAIIAPDGTVRHQVSGITDLAPLRQQIDALLAEFKLKPAPPVSGE